MIFAAILLVLSKRPPFGTSRNKSGILYSKVVPEYDSR